MSAASEGRAVAAAFTFMTRLPLGRLASHDPNDLQASAAYFPLVGAVVGGIGGGVFALTAAIWPKSIAVFLSIIATVVVTGAFHEDALADTLDGLGGGRTAERVLEIMKDSRVGSYALVGVALVLGTKFAALFSIADIGTTAVVKALIAGHVLGRWSSIPLMMKYSYVRPANTNVRASAGGPFAEGLSASRAIVASSIAFGIVPMVLGAVDALVTTIIATLMTMIAGLWFKRRIGGITGDTLGAASQIVELSVYLALLAHR